MQIETLSFPFFVLVLLYFVMILQSLGYICSAINHWSFDNPFHESIEILFFYSTGAPKLPFYFTKYPRSLFLTSQFRPIFSTIYLILIYLHAFKFIYQTLVVSISHQDLNLKGYHLILEYKDLLLVFSAWSLSTLQWVESDVEEDFQLMVEVTHSYWEN